MANKIQIRRGLKSKLPTLSSGELAYTTDTRETFVGTGSGNVNMGGSHWYRGTAMSGTVTTTGYYSFSACPRVKVDDIYLNTSNGNIYACTTAGSGTSAKWTYQGSIKGPTGATGATGAAGKDAATVIVSTGSSIQSAIDSLPSTGGKIALREGTHSLSSKLTCNKNVVFEGMGDGTIINCSASSLMQIGTSTDCNVTFRNISITSDTITSGAFNCGYHLKNLYIDNVSLTLTTQNQGGIVNGRSESCTNVHLHNVRINATISNSSDCASLFNDCFVDGGEGCDIYADVLYDTYGAEVFYRCSGKFSGGKLDCKYVLGRSENMSISNCYISCASVNLNDDAGSHDGNGRLTNNKITFGDTGIKRCHFAVISNNEIKKDISGRLYLDANIVSLNKIQNYTSKDIAFQPYACVIGNVFKYSMPFTTPTGAVIANNVEYSSLSINSKEG